MKSEKILPLIPKFGKLPGEELSDAALNKATSRLQSSQREGMIKELEEAMEGDISPESLMERFDSELERIEGDFNKLEKIGPMHPDRPGSIEKLKKEIGANLEYFEGAGRRLKVSDSNYSRKVNKLRAYQDYLAA